MACPKHILNCPDRNKTSAVSVKSATPAGPTTTTIDGVTYLVTPKTPKKA